MLFGLPFETLLGVILVPLLISLALLLWALRW
jgi:hypothetical protein